MTELIEIIEPGPQGPAGAAAVPVAGDWIVHQNIVVPADTLAGIEFTGIPTGVKFIRIEGMLSASIAGLVTKYGLTVNGDVGVNYAWQNHHHTATGTTVEDNEAANDIRFSSEWSAGEKAIINMHIEALLPLPGLWRAFQCHTSNTGGDGDNHTTGARYNVAGEVSSIQIFTKNVFTIPAQPIGPGTDLTMYIKY